MNIQSEYLPKQRQSVYEKYMKQLGEKQTNLNLAEDALNLLKYNGIRPYYDEKETKLILILSYPVVGKVLFHQFT